MAVAETSGIYQCSNCYKVPGLSDPVLDTPHVSFLQDRYNLGEELGWGQFGVIRVCSDLLTGESLACKSIAKDRLISLEDLRSVKLEIEVMALLSGHPNVVGLKAVYEDKSCVHLIMELCAGGELFHRLEKHGRFSEPDARVLFRDLMEVVMYCHDKGIVHRDLKPENILLDNKSSSSPIKLADFGLATYIKPGQSLNGTVGSPFYIAPEVLAGGYNKAADVWSAGVILYILLSGIPPFWGKTKSRIFDAVRSEELRFPSEHWDLISASAKALIAGMLCRDPAQRLTAAQVLDHPWIKGCLQQPQGSYGHDTAKIFGQCDSGPYIVDREVSFGSGSPVPCPPQIIQDPLAVAFRSSFSAFLVDTTPCSPTMGFSFQSSFGSNNPEFSYPIPSLPSFAFFSPLANENESTADLIAHLPEADLIQRDPSFGDIFRPLDSGPAGESEEKVTEVRRFPITTRAIGIHHKRNHTIGLGELVQLDLMISESIIRWASCTQLPSAPSLRSSLVC